MEIWTPERLKELSDLMDKEGEEDKAREEEDERILSLMERAGEEMVKRAAKIKAARLKSK